jgi:hypothetical protein
MKKLAEKLEAPTGLSRVDVNGSNGSRVAVERKATIKPVNFKTVKFDVVGDDPMVMNRMGKKGREGLDAIATRSATEGKSQRAKKVARDFDAEFKDAQHRSTEGWVGIAAMGVKHGMVNVCVISDFYKSRAKMLLFVEPDGYSEYAVPLFRITKGTPKRYEDVGRVKSGGMMVNVRAMFAPGWEATVTIKYDADALSLDDVANLLNRAGQQCGIGEGRPSSRDSVGCGWGRYKIKGT